MADKNTKNKKTSGFDVDIPFANPYVYPKGTSFKRNADGTITARPKTDTKKKPKK